MGPLRTPVAIRSGCRRLGAATPVDARDRVWLALGLLPGVVAVAAYLATNTYPAHGAGLYTKITAEIVANGYAPPVRVPGYTAAGVSFAYPPLQFYLLAVLFDLGADPLAVARLLPGVAVVAALLPVYLLGRGVADSRPAGSSARSGSCTRWSRSTPATGSSPAAPRATHRGGRSRPAGSRSD